MNYFWFILIVATAATFVSAFYTPKTFLAARNELQQQEKDQDQDDTFLINLTPAEFEDVLSAFGGYTADDLMITPVAIKDIIAGCFDIRTKAETFYKLFEAAKKSPKVQEAATLEVPYLVNEGEPIFEINKRIALVNLKVKFEEVVVNALDFEWAAIKLYISKSNINSKQVSLFIPLKTKVRFTLDITYGYLKTKVNATIDASLVTSLVFDVCLETGFSIPKILDKLKMSNSGIEHLLKDFKFNLENDRPIINKVLSWASNFTMSDIESYANGELVQLSTIKTINKKMVELGIKPFTIYEGSIDK